MSGIRKDIVEDESESGGSSIGCSVDENVRVYKDIEGGKLRGGFRIACFQYISDNRSFCSILFCRFLFNRFFDELLLAAAAKGCHVPLHIQDGILVRISGEGISGGILLARERT